MELFASIQEMPYCGFCMSRWITLLLCVLTGCGSSNGENGQPPVVRGPSGCTKVCQLIGDGDLETGLPTNNQTWTRSGIYGTDLGASFEHGGKLWFLFGDTVGASMNDEDSIAWSEDTDPEDCLDLTFLTDANGKWIPPVVPGVSLEAFEVPMEGVSAGGSMYAYFTTDHTEQHIMGRSILARSNDEGLTFEYIADISTLGPFINLAVEVVDNASWPGLPESSGQGLLIWGSGEYRQSSVSLAFQPLDQIEDPSSIRYYAGSDSWSTSEADAIPLFEETCVGELSVLWNPHLEKWLMTYNCGWPRGILFRTADQPWGPWSKSAVLFDPDADGGYCHFMHVSWEVEQCDNVYDPGRENEYGGEYGPYQIGRFARATAGGSMVYFTMSTWNPYNVVLMRAELVKQ
jgi:hypothetical protein